MPRNDEPMSIPEKQIPLTAAPANVAAEPTQLGNMLGSTLQVGEPAQVTASALATTDLGEASFKNNLGTPRPSEIMLGVDETKTYMYMVPVRPDTPGATKVNYKGGRCFFNLYILFKKLDRLVQAGYREYYAVHFTPGEVTIGTVKGWGLYVKLTEVTKEPITRLSEEERARRAAKRRQTIAAKKAAKAAGQEGAPGAVETEA